MREKKNKEREILNRAVDEFYLSAPHTSMIIKVGVMCAASIPFAGGLRWCCGNRSLLCGRRSLAAGPWFGSARLASSEADLAPCLSQAFSSCPNPITTPILRDSTGPPGVYVVSLGRTSAACAWKRP